MLQVPLKSLTRVESIGPIFSHLFSATLSTTHQPLFLPTHPNGLPHCFPSSPSNQDVRVMSSSHITKYAPTPSPSCSTNLSMNHNHLCHISLLCPFPSRNLPPRQLLCAPSPSCTRSPQLFPFSPEPRPSLPLGALTGLASPRRRFVHPHMSTVHSLEI